MFRQIRLDLFFLSMAALILCGSTRALAEDWPQFRGPESRGVSEAMELPDRWSESENVVWKTPIAGRGWSSPIVVGDRLFLTTVTRNTGKPEDAKPGLYFGGNREKPADVPHAWKAICLDRKSGKPLWEKTLHQGKPATSRHIKNSYASETPVSDGERLYVLFGDVGLYCLTVDGDLVWQKELPPCKTRYDWGTAASPVLHEGRLYLISDNEDASYLAAIDAKTGEQVWRVERDEKSNWSTPFIWKNELRTEIITPGTGRIRSYDLDGKLLYELSGCSSITIAMPYAAHGLLYVSSGYVNDDMRPIFAIRPGASGDISLRGEATSNEFIAWCQPKAAPYNPSTIVYGDQLYVLHDRGLMASYDALTGEVIYEKKRIPGGRSFTSSPWAYEGKIFCLNEFGKTLAIAAGPEFKLLQTNELDSTELCMTTPAIADGQLILRTGDAVYCIAKP
ncbi:PQQ-binding-like beta-propeller repeat protein [Rosistilla oblonga]|uniref:outer membrane protein assembly factor BamB family protein n=1 Tax=Rosistilla oblonga TaxID=2527990 RepID=UPI003A9796D3